MSRKQSKPFFDVRVPPAELSREAALAYTPPPLDHHELGAGSLRYRIELVELLLSVEHRMALAITLLISIPRSSATRGTSCC